MRKVLLGLLILVFMVALIANPSKAQDNKYRIGVVFKALDSYSWLAMKRGVEVAAQKNGIEVSILAPDREVNVQQQIQIIEDLITQKFDALCIAPCGSQELIPTLDRAYESGIPVIIIDTNTPWEKKVCFVGMDSYEGGAIAGQFIADQLKGKGNVALITGVMGHETHMQRVKGAEDIFTKYPDIKIVAKQPANSERALGMQVMENILSSNPNLDAVFCTNDEMALGALQALKAANRVSDVILVGFDCTMEALESIIKGEITADVAFDSFAIGYYGVEAAVKVLNGEEVPSFVNIGTSLVTEENAEELLKLRENQLEPLFNKHALDI